MIPLVAVPVSIIGTFAVLLAFGFSINTLSLFGLVLAIGIVVDDAIVVVENVERHIADGLSPAQATKVAMSEVSRPIIAITLVLCAVFVPVAFVSGLTGEFYRQFALTIAISTVISAFNSLTLSPALAAVLLKPHGATPDRLLEVDQCLVGSILQALQPGLYRGGQRLHPYADADTAARDIALVLYGGLIALTYFGFNAVPGGFVPDAGQAVPDRDRAIAARRLPRAHRCGHATHRRDRPQDNRASPHAVAVRGHVGERLHLELERRAHFLCAR